MSRSVLGDGQDGEGVALFQKHGGDFPLLRIQDFPVLHVDVPNALHGRQQELIHDAAARLEDAHHREGFVGVDVGLVFQAVGAEECVSNVQP